MKFKPLGNPILIISDNPALHGGLSRFCRDMATLCCTLPQLRVAILGKGIGHRRKFPFITYDYPEYPVTWGEDYIQWAWEDFSGGENGIIFTLDDITRRQWFVNPIGMSEGLQKFLGPGRNFQRWGHFPIDSTGPDGKSLSLASTDCVRRYDRVIASSSFGEYMLKTCGVKSDWLPHGLWLDKFKCNDCTFAHSILGWSKDDIHVGCVMANQSRKDFPAAFECFALLREQYGNRFKAWIHTTGMMGYWNIYALSADFGIGDCLEVTTDLTDEQLALRYTACSCTILPTAGEGFGFPIAESQACGTACVTTDYAGGAELVPATCQVAPRAYRIDTQHNVVRAVLDGGDFAGFVELQIRAKRDDWEGRSQTIAGTVSYLDWNRLKYPWTRWIKEGLK